MPSARKALAAQSWERSERRRLIKLLSAGWLPPSVSSSRGFPRSRGRASGAKLGHITSDGSSPPFVLHSRLWAAARRGCPPLRWRDLPADCPQERSHLAGNRSHDDWKLLACGAEPTVTGAKADLRLPGDVAHGLRQAFEPGSQGIANSAPDSDRSRRPR